MKKRGFTLIELMVVVVIIGILAAIAIPNFIKIVDKAKQASVKANQHTAQVAVESLAIDLQGSYPTDTDAYPIREELPPNYKNPYEPAEPIDESFVVTANADFVPADGGADDQGHVEYAHNGDDDNATGYTIVGYGKLGKRTDLTLIPGK